MEKIIIRRGRETSLKRKHPWIFDGAVARVDGDPAPGATVEVYSSDGAWLARAAYSPQSQIRARVWTFDREETVDEAFFSERITGAIRLRQSIAKQIDSSALRLIYSESDRIPGLIADRYDETIVCQFLSAGAEHWRKVVVDILAGIEGVKTVYERSDTEGRRKEGLEPSTGLLSGEEPPEYIRVREGSMEFLVDVRNGHKTGLYLDQRTNRKILTDYADGREVLNCFSYTGGFGIAALKSGAKKVVNVDTSENALELGSRNGELNGLDRGMMESVNRDVFQLLRSYRDSRQDFDLIVLDPPKFISSASQLRTGSRGYKDINLLAIKLLRKNGILMTFSCSGHVDPMLFRKIVADAALDSGRQLHFIQSLTQAHDHPVLGSFPEGLYLKGLVCLAD